MAQKRPTHHPYQITFQVTGFEKKSAILQSKNPAGIKIKWPTANMPKEVKEGTEIKLNITQKNPEKKTLNEKYQLLEEIIN